MSFENPVSFFERCLLAVFNATRHSASSLSPSSLEDWIETCVRYGFIDLTTVSLDFAVILILGLPQDSPHRKTAEGRMLDEERRSKGFEAGQALLGLLPLFPLELYSFQFQAMRGNDFRAQSIVSSALFHGYGTGALLFVCRLFGLKSTDVICHFTETIGTNDIDITITPKSWIFNAIRQSQDSYEPEGPSFRSILFGHLFRELLRTAPIRLAAGRAIQQPVNSGRDSFERAFLTTCRLRLPDIEDQMLLFAVIYGQLTFQEVVLANAIAWEHKQSLDGLLTGKEIELRFLELWETILAK